MRDRTWKMLAVAVLLGPALMVGCKGDGGGGGGTGPSAGEITLAQPVKIVESVKGNSQALKTIGVKLIKSKAAYDALGDAEIFPGGVDFGEYDLVIASLGEQPTGGYAIQINALQLEGDTLVVVGKATKPGADDATTQAFTYPYAAVTIEKTDATLVVPDIDD